MKRNRKGSKRRRQVIQIWTLTQAHAALPYITSVVRSVREHRLEAQRLQLVAHRLASQPGRPDRMTLIDHQEALAEAQRAEDRFEEALLELQALDVYCLEPIRGEALIPFVDDNQLAWFVFSLYDTEPLRFWRYESDPLETRRPIEESAEGKTARVQVV